MYFSINLQNGSDPTARVSPMPCKPRVFSQLGSGPRVKLETVLHLHAIRFSCMLTLSVVASASEGIPSE
jgi:hypothetical protein